MKRRGKHFGEHHQAQEHKKGHDGLNHAHHGAMNQAHGLPKDAFGHGGADYGQGNPHGGVSGMNQMGGGPQGGGPVGPIGEGPEPMTENYGEHGDDLSEC